MAESNASRQQDRSFLDASGLRRLPAVPDVHHLNFAWLIRLRWVAIVGQTAVIVASATLLGLQLPYATLAAILVAEVVSNIGLIAWAKTGRPYDEPMAALVLIADIVFLTALLFFTGGAANPFSLLYLIHVALAALVLSPAWTWGVTVVSAAAYVGLHFPAYSADQLPWASAPQIWTLEIQGRWVAFAVSAAVIAFFINTINNALQERDRQLMEARDAQMKNEKLASLATLAAGAAHEFSTPLSTIAIVSNELQRNLEDRELADHLVEDAALIRDQVEHCREILHRMSADAGESMGEAARPVAVARLVDETLDGCRDPDRVDVVVEPDETTEWTVPVTALGQALRGLVNNGLEASEPDQNVELRLREDDELIVEIRDDGHGMDPETVDRAAEPFFTTKETDEGMGLGVFLARTLVEKLEGTISMDSSPGDGTTVRVRLPDRSSTDSPLVPDTPDSSPADKEVAYE